MGALQWSHFLLFNRLDVCPRVVRTPARQTSSTLIRSLEAMTSSNFIYPTMMLTRENLDDRICIEGASQSYTWKDLLCRIEGYRLAFVARNHKRIAIYFDELID